MDHPLFAVGAALVTLAGAVSAALYRHNGGAYAAGKSRRIGGGESFRWVYRYLQVSTVAIGVAAFSGPYAWLLLVHQNQALQLFGLCLTAVALSVFVVAKRTLGRAYSPCFHSYVPRSLVDQGVYAWVRHPIYSANLLLLLGLFVATGSLWLGLNSLILAAYYVPSARREETALADVFPEYHDYLQRTKMFLPFII